MIIYGDMTILVGRGKENWVKEGFHHEGNLWPKYRFNGGGKLRSG